MFSPADKQTHCFQQYSLPFGARSSVVAFLRCARMLQWLALKLDIIVTCYFDDYVCISGPSLASNTAKCFETLLDLLGWKYDKSGDKADEMSDTIAALGVVFDLNRTKEGFVVVSNTEKESRCLLTNPGSSAEGLHHAARSSCTQRPTGPCRRATVWQRSEEADQRVGQACATSPQRECPSREHVASLE